MAPRARPPKVPFVTSVPRQAEQGAVVIGLNEMLRLRKRFGDLEKAMGDTTALVEAIGEQQVNSAKRRIGETKRSPSGRAWKPWSESYWKTREPQHTLLVNEGNLLSSIVYEAVSPGEVLVGSPLDYAGVHLHGSKDGRIPARPYLDTTAGFADSSDRRELRDVIRDFWESEVGR